jgi:hypothetical protein
MTIYGVESYKSSGVHLILFQWENLIIEKGDTSDRPIGRKISCQLICTLRLYYHIRCKSEWRRRGVGIAT